MIPEEAKLETVLCEHVAIYDVSHVLPRHGWRKYPVRDAREIVRVYHHHSGALGADGYTGAARSARFSVLVSGWAGSPYTYWLSYRPDRDARGRIAIYRLQPDDVRGNHTGGDANGHGIGICWQGNLSKRKPSAEQYAAADALVPFLCVRHGLDLPGGISWHSESEQYGGSGKRTCPGPHVEAYLAAWRSSRG